MGTCLRRKVGAVAVRDRRSFADGFNGNMPGATHCDHGGCPQCINNNRAFAPAGTGTHTCVCVHAEANVVAFCAREGIRLDGATIYSTTQPCLDCMKLMSVAGVREVVYDEPYPNSQAVPPTMTMRRFSE